MATRACARQGMRRGIGRAGRHTLRTDRAAQSERGMVTSEFALAIPWFVGLAVALLAALVTSWQYMAVMNDAKEIARAVALEPGGPTAQSVIATVETRGSTVQIEQNADLVEVTVRHPGSGVYELVGVDFVGRHVTVVEP